ncbi:MAG TPA: hypothetical protein VMW24_00395, partial [Sedimentisphaerales bacterium]|nr:hypothetical protein [Sedimentisphaerales bacterium]
LTHEISARLDQARQIKNPPRRYPAFFKLVAGIAAAALIFVAVVFRTHEPSDMQEPRGSSAVVESVDKQGAVLIQIKDASGKLLATVQEPRTDKGAVKCDVEIIDRDGDLEAESGRAAWIIISAPSRTLAENEYDREEADLMCLL